MDKYELNPEFKTGVGEDFYNYSKKFMFAFLPVKCNKCGSMQFLIMDNLESVGSEEREMGPDVDTALAVTQYCAKCDSEITGDILMSNYAYEVMFNTNHFEGCEPVVLYDIEKLFLDFSKEEGQE